MTTWADVAKGDRVQMGGKVFEVVKAKRRGKKVDVKVSGQGGTFASTVKAKDAVTIARPEAAPLRDRGGRQQRWASREEHDAEERAPMLAPGNPAITEPPKRAKGDGWTKPVDETEAMLGRELGAVLIAESDDEASGYYVPPIDVGTVAMHLLTFHGRSPIGSEADMLATHDEEHRLAAANATLFPVNHWHTDKRRMKP